MGNPVNWVWGQFVTWLAGPAEAEATRLGITDVNQRNAFAHAYTAALIAYDYKGTPAGASDKVDFLGRLKEGVPGALGQQDDFRDYYRDLWNNSIGADIGNYAKDHIYSREEIGRLVKNAIADGAIISSLSDGRIPAAPSGPYVLWPIPDTPQYQGPFSAHDPNSTPQNQAATFTVGSDQFSEVFGRPFDGSDSDINSLIGAIADGRINAFGNYVGASSAERYTGPFTTEGGDQIVISGDLSSWFASMVRNGEAGRIIQKNYDGSGKDLPSTIRIIASGTTARLQPVPTRKLRTLSSS